MSSVLSVGLRHADRARDALDRGRRHDLVLLQEGGQHPRCDRVPNHGEAERGRVRARDDARRDGHLRDLHRSVSAPPARLCASLSFFIHLTLTGCFTPTNSARSSGTDGTPDEYTAIAQFYETKSEFSKAGGFYRKSNDFAKALRLFLQCGDAEVNNAIDVVGEARSEMLTNTLIDFLMGESDGVPKDPKFIFRLYMALGKYPEAVRTANIIARQEQELGNYKSAHDLLYDTFRDLEADKKRVPRELYSNLQLLHSYILVKYLIPLGDHATAARSKSTRAFRTHTRLSAERTRNPRTHLPLCSPSVACVCTRRGLL